MNTLFSSVLVCGSIKVICQGHRLFVKSRDVLLFLVVTQNDEKIAGERGRTAGAELEIHWIRFERRGPSDVAFQVEGPQTEIADEDVDEFAVGDRRFGHEAILAMTTTRRTARVKLFLPFDVAALQIEAIEQVVKSYFRRQFDVAFREALDDLLDWESLFFQFRRVLVAVFSTRLRLLRFSVGGNGG